MTNLHKTILFWVGVGFTVVLSVFLVVSMHEKLNYSNLTNTVTFNGEGKVVAKPDVAVISFSVVTEATDSQPAQDSNSAKSKAISDFLKKQGIEDKDIKTTGYNIYPQYGYPRAVPVLGVEGQYYDGSPKITGYQVTQSFEVKVRDLGKTSAVISGVVKAGANQVQNLGFQVDDPDKLKAEARQKAIADAKAKADELKGQLGIKLGRIINFSENTSGYPGPIMYAADYAKSGYGGGGGPSLPTGENEIVIDVTITYQIK